jgi:hypothetical protein
LDERKDDIVKMFQKKVGKKKDASAPKHPRSGYIIYCTEKRPHVKETQPELSSKEIISRLAEMWKSLSDTEKVRYNKMAETDKHRYETEMASYTPSAQSAESETPVSSSSKGSGKNSGKGKGSKVKDSSASASATSSSASASASASATKKPRAYDLYCKQMRDVVKREMPSLPGKDVNKELSVRWNALSTEEKANYASSDTSVPVSAPVVSTPVSTSTPVETKKGKKGKKSEASAPTPVEATPVPVSVPAPSKSKSKSEAKPEKKNSSVKLDTPGFIYFCNEHREILEEEHPNWNKNKVKTELESMWGKLSDDDRQMYESDATREDDISEVEEDSD